MQLQVNMSRALRTWHDILLSFYVFIFISILLDLFFSFLAALAGIRDRMIEKEENVIKVQRNALKVLEVYESLGKTKKIFVRKS